MSADIRPLKNCRGPKGMTLMEVLIAIFVLAVGLLAIVSTILACMDQTDADREDMIALGVARQQLQMLQSYCTAANFSNMFSKFGPGSANLSENQAYPVDVFAPTNGTPPADGGNVDLVTALNNINVPIGSYTFPSGTVQILFPVDASGTKLLDNPPATSLVPNPQVQFGLPAAGLDLTGKGNTPDANDHSGDYKLLPVIVRVQWQGTINHIPRTLEIHALLSQLYQ